MEHERNFEMWPGLNQEFCPLVTWGIDSIFLTFERAYVSLNCGHYVAQCLLNKTLKGILKYMENIGDITLTN